MDIVWPSKVNIVVVYDIKTIWLKCDIIQDIYLMIRCRSYLNKFWNGCFQVKLNMHFDGALVPN